MPAKYETMYLLDIYEATLIGKQNLMSGLYLLCLFLP